MPLPPLFDIPPLLGLLSIVAVCAHGVRAPARQAAAVKVGARRIAPGRRHGKAGFVLFGMLALAGLGLLLGTAGGVGAGIDAMRVVARLLGWAGLLNALLIALQLAGRRR